jgi:hypothetical protein
VLNAAGDLVSKVKDKLTFWDSPPELFGLHVGQRLVGGIAEGLSESARAEAAAAKLVEGLKNQLGAISEDDPRWDWRTMGNKSRGVFVDGKGWMLQDAQGNLSSHPYPAGTPKKDGMVYVGNGMWVPAGTAGYPLGGSSTAGTTTPQVNTLANRTATPSGPLIGQLIIHANGDGRSIAAAVEDSIRRLVADGTVGRAMSKRRETYSTR